MAQVRMEKVIANAYSARGPLKRYYLACKTSDWEEGITEGKRTLGPVDGAFFCGSGRL